MLKKYSDRHEQIEIPYTNPDFLENWSDTPDTTTYKIV